MKIRNLFFAAAAAVALVACEEKVDLGPEKVEIISGATIEIPAAPEAGASFAVKFVSTVDWKLQGYDKVASWLAVSAESGKASADEQTITFTASANTGLERKAELSIYGNVLAKAPISIVQKAGKEEKGTADSPYSASTALQMIKDGKYAAGENVYVAGIISSIKEVSTQYKNATYSISDDGSATNALTVFRGKYLAGADFTAEGQIKVGDNVVVYGMLTNHSTGGPQVDQGSQIYSLNGESDGEIVTPDYDAAEAKTVDEFITAASKDTYYKLTGKISNVVAASGHFDLTDASGTIYCYQVTNAAAYKDRLSENDEVTIAGLYEIYEGKHELVKGYILSLTDGQAAAIELAHPLTSNVTWVTEEDNNKSYDNEVIVNGETYPAIKLGGSKAVGRATINLPANSTKLNFYATGWNKKDGVVEVLNGTEVVKTVTAKMNTGANNQSPFTYVSLTDEDNYFTVDVPAGVTSLDVRTTSANPRAILFGINAE